MPKSDKIKKSNVKKERISDYAGHSRPENLNEVVGNKVVVDILKQRIEEKSFKIGTILVGPPGTGKTTLSYIILMSINCQSPKGPGEPCYKCDSCNDAIRGVHPDILDINSAINNGVDDARAITKDIKSKDPTYEITGIILDECHRITSNAFDALLKPIEGSKMGKRDRYKRPNYMFLMPTTSIKGIPEAIISRCEVLYINPVSKKELVEYLSGFCEKHDIKYEEDALELLFAPSQGRPRQALSLLETVSYSNKFNVTKAAVKKYLNNNSSKLAKPLLEAIENLNIAQVRTLIDTHIEKEVIDEKDFDGLFDLINAKILKNTKLNSSVKLYTKCLSKIVEARDKFSSSASESKGDYFYIMCLDLIDIIKLTKVSIILDSVYIKNTEYHDTLANLNPRIKKSNNELIFMVDDPDDEDDCEYIEDGLQSKFIRDLFKELAITSYEIV